MAAITIVWDPTTPLGSEAISNGDNRITEFKLGLAERLRNGGHQWSAASSTDQEDGRHVCGTAFSAGATGALAGEFYWYDRDGSTVIMTLRDATAATPSELFLGAFKLRTTGDVSSATGTFSGAVTIGGTLAAGVTTITGILKPEADNTRDLGVAVTNRWRDLLLGRNAVIGGNLTVTGTTTLAGNLANVTLTGSVTLAAKQIDAAVSVITGASSVAATDRIILAQTGGASFTLTLPAVASSTGRELWIAVKTQGSSVTDRLTVDPNGAEKINNAATVTLSPSGGTGTFWHGIHIFCDGTEWHVLDTFSDA